MEQILRVQSYQARRKQVLDLLEDSDKPLTLKEMKDEYLKKYGCVMPFSEISDDSINDWLLQIENIGYEIVDSKRVYFFRKYRVPIENNKRKTSSPLPNSSLQKRSRSAPEAEEIPTSSTRNEPRQSRAIRFKDQVNKVLPIIRSKSEHRNAILGAPNFYGSLLIGDDFFLGLASWKLNFNARRVDGVLKAGFCVSGLTISKARELIERMDDDDRYKTAILYVGSIDIIMNRELIQMMQDVVDLCKVCLDKNIRPIFCTLAPLPNYLLGNRRETLNGFNVWIRTSDSGVPVIDLHKAFIRDSHENFESFCYTDMPRSVSGCRKPLVLWSKNGRDRAFNMLLKNIGIALTAQSKIVCGFF